MSERHVAAFAGLVDLASEVLGGEALATSDDFFAGCENLLRRESAVFDPDAYTERGKLMDGWESRRRRVPGHDWCVVRLGTPGRIRGVDIDTHHFLGNHPPFASLEACAAPGASLEELLGEVEWTEVLAQTPLQRSSRNLAPVSSEACWTHVRLNIFPAGGVARLRVYGDPEPVHGSQERDLAALAAGGRTLACSDMFFSPMENLLMPGQPENMGQGWETRRSRPPGEDWIIVQLGEPGRLSRVEVHTTHFKGNYPEACALDGLYWPGAPPWSLVTAGRWTELRGWSPLRAHAAHELELEQPGPWTHVRLRIRPDGGVARLRVHGTPTDERPGDSDPLVSGLNALDADAAAAALGRCCGARRWVAAMVAARPFSSRTELLGVAETAWWRLGEVDWLEAFEHHPRIGADVEALREKFAATAGWSEGEQSGVEGADEATLQALADCNRRYEAAHGFIFIVCASGKSAEEMLAIVQQRLPSERHMELNVAAGEQAKITALRLEKLELP